MRREEAQEDALQSFQHNINPGSVKGILLYFNGTNAASTTSDIDDLGTVTIKRFGETQHDRRVRTYADLNNLRRGQNLFSSAEAGDFKATVFIPFYEKTFEQAYSIEGNQELNIRYEPGTGTPGNFSSMDVTVYSVTAQKPEFYQFYMLGNDQTPSASITGKGYQLNQANVSSVFVDDRDSVLTELGLRVDGAESFTDQPADVIEAGTLLDNRLETSTFDLLELQVYTEDEPLSVINQNSVLKVSTSGSGTIEITVASMVFNDDTRLN